MGAPLDLLVEPLEHVGVCVTHRVPQLSATKEFYTKRAAFAPRVTLGSAVAGKFGRALARDIV
jgi:hypothetical protein